MAYCCDFCQILWGREQKATVDGALNVAGRALAGGYSWANMCDKHHKQFGVGSDWERDKDLDNEDETIHVELTEFELTLLIALMCDAGLHETEGPANALHKKLRTVEINHLSTKVARERHPSQYQR